MLIATERTYIRELSADDHPSMKRIAEDFAGSDYAVFDMPLPVEDEAVRALTLRFAASGLFFAVERKDSREMIGYICFHEDSGDLDLGYCFHSGCHRKGYAFESCSALLDRMAQTRPGVRFTAGTALKNIPSRALLRKLDFELTGTETLSFHKDGQGRDILFEGGRFVRKANASHP